MTDYFDTDRAWESHEEKKGEMVLSEEKRSLNDRYNEILNLTNEASDLIEQVKNNPALLEFAQAAKDAGSFGVMGMVPKIPALLPELAPVMEALQIYAKASEKMQILMGEMIVKIEGAE